MRPTQKAVCENQCTMDLNDSEADTAPLFKIELYGVVGLLVSTQPDQREHDYVDALLYRSTIKEETFSLYTGSDLAIFRHANMICDANK